MEKKEEQEKEERDALCPECGHGFTAYVDRLLAGDKRHDYRVEEPCPVCGCGECKIGK